MVNSFEQRCQYNSHKKIFSTNGARANLISTCKKIKLYPYITRPTKINSK